MIARTARTIRATMMIVLVLPTVSLRLSKKELTLLLSEQKVSFSFAGIGNVDRSNW